MSFRSVRAGVLVAVTLLALAGAGTLSCTQIQAAPAAGDVVAGRVVSSADGHPLANATVVLGEPQRVGSNSRRSTPNSDATVRTDAEGRFRFAPQRSGRYSLRASAPGFSGMRYLEHEGFSTAVVLGAGLETGHLDFALVPASSIHGRILDDTGEAVRGSVFLYRQNEPGRNVSAGAAAQRVRHAGATQADDDGRYEFANLQPGTYFVSINATPWYAVHPRPTGDEERLPYRSAVDPAVDVVYPMTFYPHATTEDGATPLVLKPGQRIAANITLQPEKAMTLTVHTPAQEGGMRAFPMLFRKVFGTDQPVNAQNSGLREDTFVLSGLAAGNYTLRSGGRNGDLGTDTPIHLATGSMTVEAAPPSTATADVSLTLHEVNGGPITNAERALLILVPSERQTILNAKIEGSAAEFPVVPAGDYRVRLVGDAQSWSVAQLTVAGKPQDSRLLHVAGDAKVQADVSVSQYAPEIEGVVRSADGKVHPGAMVVLVPAGRDTSEDLFRGDQSDLDGGFQFANVLPGNYLIVAIDEGWRLNWRDPAALAGYLQRAVPVVVAASGPKTVRLQEAVLTQQR